MRSSWAVVVLACGAGACGGPGTSEPQGHQPRKVDFGVVRERAAGRATPEGPTRLTLAGATLDIAAGALDGPTDVELLRAVAPTQPPGGRAGEVFYLASRMRPLVTGAITLSLSATAGPAGAAADDLQVFFYTRGIWVPVPSTRDASGAFVIENPDATVMTTPADPRRGFAWPAISLATAAAPPGPEAPVGGYALGTPKAAQPPLCEAGSVHEEPGHVFQIVVEKPASCDLVRFVSTTLQETVDA
jgi:hypothetical protein